MSNNNLFPSTELVATVALNSVGSDDFSKFVNDPQGTLSSDLDIDVSGVSINIVENDSGTVNLILPYYALVDEFQAATLDDSAIDEVSGGEIFITLCIFGGMAAGAVIAGTTTAAVVGATVGGVVGAAVVGTAVVGGAVAGTLNEDSGGK